MKFSSIKEEFFKKKHSFFCKFMRTLPQVFRIFFSLLFSKTTGDKEEEETNKKKTRENNLKMLQGSNINIHLKKIYSRKNKAEMHTQREKQSKEQEKKKICKTKKRMFKYIN